MRQGDIIFVGDEVTAQGFRLAGARVCTPEPGSELAGFRDARRDGALILLDPDCARRLPRNELDAALGAMSPMVLVVPSRPGADDEFSPASRARRILGFEA